MSRVPAPARAVLPGNREPRLAQSFEDRIHEAAREVPGSDVRARVLREFGIERQQVPHRGLGFGAPAEVAAGRRHDQEGPEETGHVHAIRAFQGLLVSPLSKCLPEGSEMIQPA